jgi:hypothetical protein
MPMFDMTEAELGHLYDAVDRGICSLDDQLGDDCEEQFYSDEEWAAMHADRDRWARMLGRLATAIEETANADD